MNYSEQFLVKKLVDLAKIPSPSGFTDTIITYLDSELRGMGFIPHRTRKGALVVEIGGQERPIVLAAHVDTLGAMVKSLKPLVNIQRIAVPEFKNKERFILQIRKGCVLADAKVVFETDNYNVVSIEVESMVQLLENECILKIADEENKEEFIAHEEEVLERESEEKIKELRLKQDLLNALKTKKFIKKELLENKKAVEEADKILKMCILDILEDTTRTARVFGEI